MNKPIIAAAVAAFAFSAGGAVAAPVDLTSWSAEGQGTWTVANPADTVLQSINGEPTVFHNNSANSQGTALSGSIKVEASSNWDDDFIGFVLGYEAGELNSATADYWLIDWKQANQNAYGATGLAGLALSHVTGAETDTEFWGHTGVVNEVARGTNLGSTGWADETEYTFDLTFTSTLIEVFVDGDLEISFSGNFTDGGFGFYNFSQGHVTYAGISNRVIPPINPSVVPLPAGMPIMLTALGIFGWMARRRKA